MWGTRGALLKLGAHHELEIGRRFAAANVRRAKPKEPCLMAKMKSLEDLFISMLKVMYYAEK